MTEQYHQNNKTSDQLLCTLRLLDVPIINVSEIDDPIRANAIAQNSVLWTPGTILRYKYISGGPNESDDQKVRIKAAFDEWHKIANISFVEVGSTEQAEIRISFLNSGSWSYLGKNILQISQTQPTINFGWPLSYQPDTAAHEIGHTLGLNHEHQNPKSGIVWNEAAVYEWAARTQGWSQATTYSNILKKIDIGTVVGSDWDKDSIMHYKFPKGLIIAPEIAVNGVTPKGGISLIDIETIKSLYPYDIKTTDIPIGQEISVILEPGKVAAYTFVAKASNHQILTSGVKDTILSLWDNGKQIAENDDGGTDYNAIINQSNLVVGTRYEIRVRLYFSKDSGTFGLKVV